MCGLGGFVDRSGAMTSGRRQGIAQAMAAQLEHRGPDETVVEHRDDTTLVFTRLALTAPENGRQPFVSEDGMIQVIANGEVYNHRELERGIPGIKLRTRSDCEILLHLYERDGEGFLDRVQGMIACVVVDLRKKRILLGRDEFGIKPLFHTTGTQPLVFGSEIKTLLSHPDVRGEIDWEGALGNPALSATPGLTTAGPTSWFEGIELVPAGTIRSFDLKSGGWSDRAVVKPDYGFDALNKREDFVQLFDEILTDSVRACATADVGLGIFLSGGVDSVLVAALAGTPDLPTFSILTEGTLASADARNAWESAGYLGLSHHQVVLHPQTVPTADEWVNLVRTVESPQTGPEQYFKYSMHQLARQLYPNLKGMLLGAAADEYYGGYSKMLADGGTWDDFLNVVRSMESRGANNWVMEGLSPVRPREKKSPSELYDAYLAWKTSDVKQYNLWHEDRTAAAFGTEARVPYLDARLVALINAVPPEKHAEFLHDKSILREVAARHLPDHYAYREKVPFYHGHGFESVNITFGKMLASNDFELLDRAFQSERSKEHIDVAAVRTLVNATLKAPSRHRIDKILRLVNLGLLEDLNPDSVSYGSTGAAPHVSLTGEFTAFSEAVPSEFSSPTGSAVADMVLRFEPDSIMADVEEDGSVLLIQSGEINFVVENRQEATFRFLDAINGVADFKSICADLNIDPSTVTGTVRTLLHAGFLQEVSK